MTLIGWIQILLYCAIVIALVPWLGGYMTRVFNGERIVEGHGGSPQSRSQATA